MRAVTGLSFDSNMFCKIIKFRKLFNLMVLQNVSMVFRHCGIKFALRQARWARCPLIEVHIGIRRTPMKRPSSWLMLLSIFAIVGLSCTSVLHAQDAAEVVETAAAYTYDWSKSEVTPEMLTEKES